MKKIIKIILLVVCIFSFTNVNASTNTRERTPDNLLVPNHVTVSDYNRNIILNTPSVDETEKVYDFADLYSDDDEKNLYDKVDNFIKQTNMDLAIVTIEDNNKYSARDYADDFYDYNSFGIGVNHDGLLLLIDMDTREIYISTTGKAMNVYSNSRVDYILDNTFEYFSDGFYEDGTSNIIGILLSYYNVGDSGNYVINSNGKLVKSYTGYYIALGVAVVVTIIGLVILVSMNRMVFKASSSRVYLNNNTKRLNRVNEIFLGSHVSKVRIDHSSGGSGGSSHSGSSGVSHGGGGHRF